MSRQRTRIGRPYRRVRRWARHNPNGTVAVNLIFLGGGLVLVAVLVALIF